MSLNFPGTNEHRSCLRRPMAAWRALGDGARERRHARPSRAKQPGRQAHGLARSVHVGGRFLGEATGFSARSSQHNPQEMNKYEKKERVKLLHQQHTHMQAGRRSEPPNNQSIKRKLITNINTRVYSHRTTAVITPSLAPSD